MGKQLKFRLIIDSLMTMLLLVAFAYQLVGNLAHEIIGAFTFILFITHNILNKKWYTNLLNGKYNIYRTLGTIVNVSLIIDMLVLAISAVMISRNLFSFLNLSGGFVVRTIHVFAAHLGLVLVSIHLGLHWNMILSGMKKMVKSKNALRTIILRITAILIALYGVKSSFDMAIGSKLTMQSSYGYWNFENSASGFFIAYLSIMGLYIFIAHYSLTLIRKFIII